MSGEFRSEHLDQVEAEIELKTIVMQPCVRSSTGCGGIHGLTVWLVGMNRCRISTYISWWRPESSTTLSDCDG